ncbi:hypothetical protein F0562_036196 [Nyssa sinensis]|uniref:Calponin-homology (CH) domain-containing protein n=1 Tax=Nyssa sinensis TaxID=561372 RepID=A0A5J5AI80_9ASTE|nr:hypothetical protein F0562_036196 [Nyssa sinensis]
MGPSMIQEEWSCGRSWGQDGEAYAHLLNVLAPEHCSPATLNAKDPTERANLVLEHAERMDCKRYLTPKDIVEGSTNLNLARTKNHISRKKQIRTKVDDGGIKD